MCTHRAGRNGNVEALIVLAVAYLYCEGGMLIYLGINIIVLYVLIKSCFCNECMSRNT